MRTVYQAQAVEARRALAVCWTFLFMICVASWWSAVGSWGEDDAFPLISAGLGTVAVLLFVRLQLATCRGGESLARRWIAPVVAMLCLSPLLWGPLPPTGLIVWAAVLLQRDRRAAAVETLGMLAFFWWALGRSDPYVGASFLELVAELGIYTAVLIAVTRLVVLLDSRQFARELLARRRVDLERERVSRDLHDIMGRTFVAASLRNQAAVREVGNGDAAGAARLERLHETIAKGQTQLRALTSGPAIARLEDELAASRELCDRVSVGFEVSTLVPVPEEHDGLVALVVREGVTNVLKHSRATSFRIVIDRTAQATEVVMSNDGAGDGGDLSADLESRLARAVDAAHGTTSIEHTAPGLYRTTVRIPLVMRFAE